MGGGAQRCGGAEAEARAEDDPVTTPMEARRTMRRRRRDETQSVCTYLLVPGSAARPRELDLDPLTDQLMLTESTYMYVHGSWGVRVPHPADGRSASSLLV